MTSKELFDDGINAYQIWKIICQHRNSIILISLLITALVAGCVFLKTPSWEGQTVIEIGHLGKITRPVSEKGDKDNQEERSNLVETPEQVMTRITHPSFLSEVAKNSTLVKSLSPGEVTSADVTASRIKDTALIKLEVKANSEDIVNTVTHLILEHLKSLHKEKYEYNERLLKKRISQMETSSLEINQDIKNFNTKSLKNESITADFYLKNLTSDRKYFVTEKAFLEEQLGPNYTYPTRFFSDIYITRSQLNFSKGVILFIVFVFSLFLTVIFFTVRQTLKEEKIN